MDLTLERLQSLRAVSQVQKLENLKFVHGGDSGLPFPDGHFDAIVVNGVLEWMPENMKGDPRAVQINFLKEASRVLRPGGVLYLAIENRFAARYLARREDHVGLYWSSFLPRRLSDVYSRIVRGKPYRTYTYSRRGYRRLFKDAGFAVTRILTPLPNYRYPRRIEHVERDCDWLDDSPGRRFRNRLAHSFSMLVSHSGDSEYRLARILEPLQEHLQTKGLRCDRYLLQKCEAVLFLRDAEQRQYVARLPYGPRQALRTQKNATALRLLNKTKMSLEIQFPMLMHEGRIGLDYISVETLVAGTDLRPLVTTDRWDVIRDVVTGFIVPFGLHGLRTASDIRHPLEEARRSAATVADHLLDRHVRREFEDVAAAIIATAAAEPIPTTWAHGDFNLGNCLWDSSLSRLSGVVDWDQMCLDALPGWDLIALFSSIRRRSQAPQPHAIADIAANGLNAREQQLWEEYWSGLGLTPLPISLMLGTHWIATLRHGFLHSYRHLNRNWIERSLRPAVAAFREAL